MYFRPIHTVCVAFISLFATAPFAFAQSSQTTQVRFDICELPADLSSPCVFAASVSLSESARIGDMVGWQVDAIYFRQPLAPSKCDRTWATTSVSLPTPDGLWWIQHENPDSPNANDFDLPPLMAGEAASSDGSGTSDLQYSLEGVDASHDSGHVVLDYVFQVETEEDPVEGDDEDGGIGGGGDWPSGMPGFDLNQDGMTDGRDIGPFLSRCISGCDYDVIDDAGCFVATLLGQSCAGMDNDCNNNGTPDGGDMFIGESEDCNDNGIPDECDINNGTSEDTNVNGIPDECEQDCNENGVPDSIDIVIQTSLDGNANGVPDECEPDCNDNGVPDDLDIANQISADCDLDRIPDECGADCNGNGLADSCDIDSEDPDGNGVVSEDCNGNDMPDECEFEIPPPFGSFDCDGNLVPDACDIANCDPEETWCQDCNDNGIPDSCDIDAGISFDLDDDEIPDECQLQQMQSGMGGGSAMSLNPIGFHYGTQSDEYLELLEWSLGLSWGSETSATPHDQFLQYVEKCWELNIQIRVIP